MKLVWGTIPHISLIRFFFLFFSYLPLTWHSAKTYLEEINLEHSTLLQQVAVEVQALKEAQKSELESLLKDSENVQNLHEIEKMELSQRFQDLIQDLRDHDEEQMKIKLRESMAQRNAEFSQKEKVRVVCVRVCVLFGWYCLLCYSCSSQSFPLLCLLLFVRFVVIVLIFLLILVSCMIVSVFINIFILSSILIKSQI